MDDSTLAQYPWPLGQLLMARTALACIQYTLILPSCATLHLPKYSFGSGLGLILHLLTLSVTSSSSSSLLAIKPFPVDRETRDLQIDLRSRWQQEAGLLPTYTSAGY
jgi:hypothetical protein